MSIASKAVQDFNSSISQYGNLEDAVDTYVNQKRNEIYDNWKQGVLSKLNIDQEKKQQMDELIGLGGATASAVRGSYKKFKAYQAKKAASGQTQDDTPGSESTGGDKSGEKDDADETTETTDSSQPDTVDEDESKTTDAADDEPGGEVEMTQQQPLTQIDEEPSPAQSTLGGGEGTPDAEFTGAKAPTTDTLQTGSGGVTKSSSSTADDAADDAADDVADDVAKDAADAADDAADIAATGGSTVAEEAGSSALGAIAEAGGVALDVLGPVGMAAGLGLSLYEFFHHSSKKAEKAPQSVTNPYIQTQLNTAGNIVLPSESSVLDTLGGHAAF